MRDNNLFSDRSPEIAYEIDVCSIKNTTENLFNSLSSKILEKVNETLRLDLIPFDVSRVTDPIVSNVESTLSNFTAEIVKDLGLTCNDGTSTTRRLQQSPGNNATNTSLAVKIHDAIEKINNALESTGIEIAGTVVPSFNSELFIASVDVSLDVTIATTAADVLEVVNDFLAGASNSSVTDSLGVGANSSATNSLDVDTNSSFSLDINALLNDTALSAGFDIAFGIE